VALHMRLIQRTAEYARAIPYSIFHPAKATTFERPANETFTDIGVVCQSELMHPTEVLATDMEF
jgi:hypothetical protein